MYQESCSAWRKSSYAFKVDEFPKEKMRFRTAEKKHNAEGEVHRMFLDGFKAYRWRNKIEGKRVELSQLRVV